MIHSISAREIGASMRRRHPYSLNAMSFDSAEGMVRAVQARGVRVTHVIVDTVGDPERYKTLLESRFRNGRYPAPRFTVEKKADANFPVVGAASICAKVTRDAAMRDYVFPEAQVAYGRPKSARDRHITGSSSSRMSRNGTPRAVDSDGGVDKENGCPPLGLGSGYPGDPDTKSWLRVDVDPVFGYPRLVRFSWSTVGVLLEGAQEAADKAAGVRS